MHEIVHTPPVVLMLYAHCICFCECPSKILSIKIFVVLMHYSLLFIVQGRTSVVANGKGNGENHH